MPAWISGARLHWPILALLLAAGGFRFAATVPRYGLPLPQDSDHLDEGYFEAALNILDNGAISYNITRPEPGAARGPLFPTFLALLELPFAEPAPTRVLLANAAVSCLLLAAVFALGLRIHSPLAGALAAAWLACDPGEFAAVLDRNIAVFYSLTLAAIGAAAFRWLASRRALDLTILSLCVGASLMCRISHYALPLFLAAGVWSFSDRRRRTRTAAVFLLLCGLFYSPAALRSGLLLGRWLPDDTRMGSALFFSTAAGIPCCDTMLEEQAAAAEAMEPGFRAAHADTGDLFDGLRRLAWRRIRRDPTTFASGVARNVAAFFAPALPTLALGALAGFQPAWPAWSIVCSFVGEGVIAPKKWHREPLAPLLALLAGVGLASLCARAGIRLSPSTHRQRAFCERVSALPIALTALVYAATCAVLAAETIRYGRPGASSPAGGPQRRTLSYLEQVIARSAAKGGDERTLLGALERKARILLELKDESGAEQSLRRALRVAESPGALEALAALAASRGRHREALALVERLEKASRGAPAAERSALLTRKAQIQLALKNEAGAEKSLRAALRLDESAPALSALVSLVSSRRRHAEALAYAERLETAAASAAPDERAAVLEGKARVQLALGDRAGAEKSLREAVRLAEGRASALSSLALLASSRGRPVEALELAERIVRLGPAASASERAAAFELKARAQLRLKDEAGAETSLREALRLSGTTTALFALLKLAESRGRHAEAIAYAERLAAALPASQRPALLERKAKIHLALKDAAAAENDLRESLRLSERAATLSALLHLTASQGRHSEALAYAERLERAGAAAPASSRAEVLELKARMQLALQDRSGAERSLERALAIEAGRPLAWRRLAQLKAERGRDAEAAACAERLLALLPGDPEALWMLFEAKRRGPPRELLAALSGREPPDASKRPAWLLARGHARALSGDGDGARDDFAAAVAGDPEGVCLGADFVKRRELLDPGFLGRCIGRFPASARLRNDRGVALYLAGRREPAAADFREAVKLDPGDMAARLSLLSALAALGRDSEALAVADAAIAAAGRRSSPILDQIISIRAALRP